MSLQPYISKTIYLCVCVIFPHMYILFSIPCFDFLSILFIHKIVLIIVWISNCFPTIDFVILSRGYVIVKYAFHIVKLFNFSGVCCFYGIISQALMLSSWLPLFRTASQQCFTFACSMLSWLLSLCKYLAPAAIGRVPAAWLCRAMPLQIMCFSLQTHSLNCIWQFWMELIVVKTKNRTYRNKIKTHTFVNQESRIKCNAVSDIFSIWYAFFLKQMRL